jgi:hypothetical protein
MWQQVKARLTSAKNELTENYHNLNEDAADGRPWLKSVLGLMGALLLGLAILGWFQSREPAVFSIEQAILSVVPAEKAGVTGVATTASLIGVVESMLDGYVSNDLLPPGVLLDNRANWEFGVLTQSRDLSKALREAFSRSQSQSVEDKALIIADPQLNFDNASWILPDTEKEYEKATVALKDYIARLVDDDPHSAQFYARADNLNYWLKTVESRLGSLSQRLSASVGQRRINTDLAGDAAATQSSKKPGEELIKTPWAEIDDVFYEARGTSWALIHFLKAAEKDFADVLDKKNARVSLQQIIRELEATQEPIMSPMILNGSGFGLFANHSLVMASYISRANAAMINLRELLAQG